VIGGPRSYGVPALLVPTKKGSQNKRLGRSWGLTVPALFILMRMPT
jgi:hypothetical protein